MATAYHTHTFSVPTADAADLLAGTESGKVITPDVLGPVTPAGKALLSAANVAAQRAALDLEPGTDVQAYDADLTALAGLDKSDGNIIVGNGTAWVAESGATARASLGLIIGTDVQAYSANLTEYAAVNPTTAGLALLDDVDASAQRTTLGLAIGTDVQAYDADLSAIAALAKTDGNFIVGNGTTWTAESGSTARSSLGLAIGTDVQAYSANLALWSAESPTGYLTTASAVRHDVVQTLPDGAKAQARLNIGIANNGFFHKPSRLAPCILRTGAGTLSLAAGTILEVEGNLFTYATDTAITMPTLAAGDDVAIWVRPDGQPVATLDHVSPPVTNSRKIGGAHYAPGGNATAYNTGGNTTPGFNAYSMWDEKFRPACADPRGMSLIAGKFWCDIYLLGVDHHINGTSRYNVTIADGSSPPKVPAMFGGDGSTAYSNLNWWVASEVMMSHGKQLLDYAEFAAAMFGTKEAQSSGTDPVSTILRAEYTSIWGVMLASGNLWVWGRDFGGGAAGASWAANTDGRGSTYQMENVARFGGGWGSISNSGSRASSWNYSPASSDYLFGARGRSDHLNHE